MGSMLRIRPNPECIDDENRLLVKSDENGHFKGSCIIEHEMESDIIYAFYAIVKNDHAPRSCILRGKKASYHVIDVPKDGSVSIEFTVEDIPVGKQVLCLFIEPLIDPKGINDGDSRASGYNYLTCFSLAIEGNNAQVLNRKKIVYDVTENMGPIHKKSLYSINVYQNYLLLHEATTIGKRDVFVVIQNSFEQELRGQLIILSDHRYHSSKQIIVPAMARGGIPLHIHREQACESIRLILIPEGNEEGFKEGFPYHPIKYSKVILLG